MKNNIEIGQFLHQERRKSEILLQYWETMRGNRRFASENDIDPDQIKEIWDSCFLLQVRDILKKDGNFTYLGKRILEAWAGASLDAFGELIGPNIANLGQNFQTLIDSGQPQHQDGHFRNLHKHLVRYRQCLVPLGYQGDSIDAILGCMSLKIYYD